MEKTKTNAPLFSMSYYKELLRELKPIVITFGILQALCGLVAEFSSARMVLVLVGSTDGHFNLFMIYFFVCALSFYRSHIGRNSWDFRGSLPIGKRTMVGSHVVAVLTYAAVLFVAYYVGVLAGELIRLVPGIGGSGLPVGFGYAAVQMIKTLLGGIALYLIFIIVFSVANKGFAPAAALLTIFLLPGLYDGLVVALRSYGFKAVELLFPVGSRMGAVIGWTGTALGVAVLAVLAVIAYSHAQAETFRKPARNGAIHTAIGLGLTVLCGTFAGMLGAGYYWFMIGLGSISGRTSGNHWVIPALIVAVTMLAVYFFYMWISLSDIKKACKRMMFLPIAFIVVGAAFPIARLADRKFEKLDFSADNIASVRLLEGGSADFRGVFTGSLGINSQNIRGSSAAEGLELTDEKVRVAAAELAKDYRNTISNEDYGIFNVIAGSISTAFGGETFEIKLKDGTRWTISSNGDSIMSQACENEEYLKKYTDLSRFGRARVISSDDLGNEFNEIFLEELKALSPQERYKLMGGGMLTDVYGMVSSSSFYGSNGSGYYDFNGMQPAVFSSIVIASPTYDHSTVVALTRQLPRSLEKYMQIINERSHADRACASALERLKTGDYSQVVMLASATSNGWSGNSVNIQYDDYLYNKVWDYDKEKIETIKRIIKDLAELAEKNPPISGAKHILRLSVQNMIASNDRSASVSSFGFIGDLQYPRLNFYIGLDDVTLKVFDDLAKEYMYLDYTDDDIGTIIDWEAPIGISPVSAGVN